MKEDLKIRVLGNWYAEKMKEDLEIPILDNVGSREDMEHAKRMTRGLLVFLFFAGLLLFYVVYSCVDVENHKTSYEPEILVESVYVCPISIPNKTDVWVLRFDITNLNNHTLLCIYRFEASVFSSSSYNRNRSELLATGGDFQTMCVEPLSHTSVNMTFTGEAPMNNSDGSNGTIGFDLKLHAGFIFNYHDAISYKIGDVVCRDAKLAFLTSSSNSSCGAMISDPPRCCYESYYQV